jgi:hypothetical protein
MGSSPSAFLAYGYDLGGSDEWKIHETDEYGGIDASNVSTLAWYDTDAIDGFIEQAKRHLLTAIAGFTEEWGDNQDGLYFDRKKAADAQVGVTFERYSYLEYPMFVLAAKVIDVGDDEAKPVDLAELVSHPDRPKWDAALFDAVKTLGITPKQEKPSWLLCAYYS